MLSNGVVACNISAPMSVSMVLCMWCPEFCCGYEQVWHSLLGCSCSTFLEWAESTGRNETAFSVVAREIWLSTFCALNFRNKILE